MIRNNSSTKVNRLIISKYKAGKSLRAIAKEMGVSHETVRSFIPKDLIRKDKMDPNLKKRIIVLYKKYRCFQDVATKLHLPHRQTVFQVVTAYERKNNVHLG